MSTATATENQPEGYNKEAMSDHHDHANNGVNGQNTAARARFEYGGNPLAHFNTERKFANPAPLGLSAFALTTFVLSLINIGVRGVHEPNIVVALAFGYGGLVQLLAGMWEMAVGNTFGATALSSYGGFWLSVAIVLTPGGFDIVAGYEGSTANVNDFNNAFGYFLAGWFIFTTILLICTLRSTVAFFFLFFMLDLAFLFLFLGHLFADDKGNTNVPLIKAGGYFGMFAAFAAWYNALAGIADDSNSFFIIPVAHFPWSVKGRERRAKTDRETV